MIQSVHVFNTIYSTQSMQHSLSMSSTQSIQDNLFMNREYITQSLQHNLFIHSTQSIHVYITHSIHSIQLNTPSTHSIQHNLIERNPPPRGGFLCIMFPHQEPYVRGPPSKDLYQVLRGGVLLHTVLDEGT